MNEFERIMQISVLSQGELNKRPESPEYERLYTDFLLEKLIFAYQQTHDRINERKNEQAHIPQAPTLLAHSAHEILVII